MFNILTDNPISQGIEAIKRSAAIIHGPGTFESKFAGVIKVMAPPVPNIDGLPQLRDKVNDILAPALVNKWLPPVPNVVAKAVKGESNASNK